MTGEVGAAVERLSAALGQLETALERRLGEARRGDLEVELQLMQDDRARLALELESTSARLTRVENAADHVGRRVGTAIGVIESLLARHDPARDAAASGAASARDGAASGREGAA